MAVIRNASLTAHAAAREVGEDNAVRSVARAAGQALATCPHIPLAPQTTPYRLSIAPPSPLMPRLL